MTYSYERIAAADNSYGSGDYPLPPKLSHLGRFVSNLAPTKILEHKYFVQDQIHMLTAKVNNNLSVMGDDMKSLLRLGLTRIQSNAPGTVSFYFEGHPVEAAASSGANLL
jgi:hypothetical protein